MKRSFIIVLIAIVANGCKVSPEWKTVIEQRKRLTDQWIIAGLVETDTVANTSIDLFATMPACEKDNLIYFSKEYKTYTISENRSVCSPARTEIGEWEFLRQFQPDVDIWTIIINTEKGKFQLRITKLDNATLEFERTPLPNNSSKKLLYRYIRP